MNDAQSRALARAAAQGDDEARLALGAQRVREGRCPWCDADRTGGLPAFYGEELVPGAPGYCCCASCGTSERAAGRRAWFGPCDGCPAKHIDDKQPKGDTP